jgi:predicted nucleotidyltransferase component of viral defense system
LTERIIPGVLDPQERLAVEHQFDVSARQVVRDHVISHALAAIAAAAQDEVVFFGGTALSRTLLPKLRLSEDIDLIALGNRREIGERIQTSITRRLLRPFGRAIFHPPLGTAPHPQPSILEVKSTRIQVQLVSGEGYPPWPRELANLEQRYSDSPPAQLQVLTPAAFVASKLVAWEDRRTPRDLYDLWALAEAGWITSEAAGLYGRYGQHTNVSKIEFDEMPSESEWAASLAHQCLIQTTPEHAAFVVRSAIATL